MTKNGTSPLHISIIQVVHGLHFVKLIENLTKKDFNIVFLENVSCHQKASWQPSNERVLGSVGDKSKKLSIFTQLRKCFTPTQESEIEEYRPWYNISSKLSGLKTIVKDSYHLLKTSYCFRFLVLTNLVKYIGS